MPGWKTLAYASEVFASEAVVRTWSIQFPWLDRPDFLSFRAAHANARGSFRGYDPKTFVHMQTTCWRVSEIRAMFVQKLRNHPEPS